MKYLSEQAELTTTLAFNTGVSLYTASPLWKDHSVLSGPVVFKDWAGVLKNSSDFA